MADSNGRHSRDTVAASTRALPRAPRARRGAKLLLVFVGFPPHDCAGYARQSRRLAGLLRALRTFDGTKDARWTEIRALVQEMEHKLNPLWLEFPPWRILSIEIGTERHVAIPEWGRSGPEGIICVNGLLYFPSVDGEEPLRAWKSIEVPAPERCGTICDGFKTRTLIICPNEATAAAVREIACALNELIDGWNWEWICAEDNVTHEQRVGRESHNDFSTAASAPPDGFIPAELDHAASLLEELAPPSPGPDAGTLGARMEQLLAVVLNTMAERAPASTVTPTQPGDGATASPDATERDATKPEATVPALGAYVTLRQCAKIVQKSKSLLVQMYTAGDVPEPAVRGGKGKAHEWRWAEIRPVLEAKFGRPLPVVFPGSPPTGA